MHRRPTAPLSPKEEQTLRLIALGSTPDAEFAAAILKRLESFALIEDIAGQWQLTEAGRRRHEGMRTSVS